MTAAAAVEAIVDRVRRSFPDWEGVRDARFVRQEVAHKEGAARLAQERLAGAVLRELLQRGQTDEIALRFVEVGNATTLLDQPTGPRGDLGALHDPASRTAVCAGLVALLHGDEPTPARVQRFAETLAGLGLAPAWPLATYFLYLLDPDSELFVEPETMRTFLEVVGAPSTVEAVSGAEYGRLRALAHELRGAMTAYGVRTMIDVQSLIGIVGGHRDPGDGTRPHPLASAPGPSRGGEAVWLVAPGRGAERWEACYAAGEIVIGWDELGDLREYPSAEAIGARLHQLRPAPNPQVNNALACWEFARVMRPGDEVFVKRGRSAVLGVGTITSDYRYEPGRAGYHHVRSVDWHHKGEWDTGGRLLPTKTLTGISKYPEMVAELRALVGLAPPPDADRGPRHWWLNFNPAVWSLAEAAVGHTELYTAQNEAGNNRQRYAHFQALRPGDLVVGYESTPAKRVVGLCAVTRGLHESDDGREAIEIEKTEHIEDGPTWADLQGVPALEGAEPVQNNQGSLFALTAAQYAEILGLCGLADDAPPQPPPYSVADAAAEAFVDASEIEAWVDLLRRRKNVILQGPPGVGKTFLARRLAWALMGTRDTERLRFVQFHQSYAYEDFVQGYRPSESGRFELKDGLFYEFVQAARERPGEPHVFVIDEVNRGNLSKIFGELMMLIEPDKRGRDFAIPLTYSKSARQQFYVPENVHLLGMMNTADRSLAVVDYALRRRFAFVTLEPAIRHARFQDHLRARGAGEALVERIATRLADLNQRIAGDTDLGPGFQIGHSFFTPPDQMARGFDLDLRWYERVVQTEIAPLLREYWFDRPEEADAAVRALLE